MSEEEQVLLAISAHLADIREGMEELTDVIRLLTGVIGDR